MSVRRFVLPAIAVLAAPLAPFAVAFTPTVAPVAAAACAPITLAVGGSGDPSSTHLPTNQPYTPVPWPAPSVPSDQSQAVGRANLNAAIANARAGCPGRTVNVIGYSAGAQVAGDDCNANQTVHCTLIADPRRPGGIDGNYPSVVPGYTNAPARTVTPNETEICAVHDWVCDSPNVLTDPVDAFQSLVGGFTNRHMSYYNGPQQPAPPAPAPSPVPTPKQIFEPVVQAVKPNVPIQDHYVPTPISAYVPPVLQPVVQLLPPQIKNWTPPPAPVLPALPAIQLPHIPGIN